MIEPLIYDLSSPGRLGVSLPEPDVPSRKRKATEFAERLGHARQVALEHDDVAGLEF